MPSSYEECNSNIFFICSGFYIRDFKGVWGSRDWGFTGSRVVGFTKLWIWELLGGLCVELRMWRFGQEMRFKIVRMEAI